MEKVEVILRMIFAVVGIVMASIVGSFLATFAFVLYLIYEIIKFGYHKFYRNSTGEE